MNPNQEPSFDTDSHDKWDARFDHLVDVEMHPVNEAHEIITREREAEAFHARVEQETLENARRARMASQALVGSAMQEARGPRHASRRGGRSYPEPSDSELDEFWNGGERYDPAHDTEEGRKGFEAFKHDADEATVQSLIKNHNISEAQARSILRAKSERQ